MALNIANWSDKQLDELQDLLKSADYSAVASFISQNFLCTGSRILTDPSQTTLRATVNGTDAKVVDLSAGIFQHNSLISQLDSTQTCNILNTTNGTWGTGKAAHPTLSRWSIIAVKNNEQAHTPELRWFVDDSVDPNIYSQQLTNTLINKAYYDIVVAHGTDGEGVPDAPVGYWAIAEIYVPAGVTEILEANIYDTIDISQKTPPNWTSTTRVLRLEFWSTLFNIDHLPTTGYHREGGWHIGTSLVTASANELNRLDGVGITVTPQSLTRLTNGSLLGGGELHAHGGEFSSGTNMVFYQASAPTGWTKRTDQHDKALRVVSGAGGGSGGSASFAAGLASHAHTTPAHTHPAHCHGKGQYIPLSNQLGSTTDGWLTDYQTTPSGGGGNTGGGGAWNPYYVDVIIATKN